MEEIERVNAAMSSRAPLTSRRAAAVTGLVLGISVFLLIAPLILHGPLPAGSDVYAISHYLQGFMKAFGEGDLYPRWTDRTNQSLGAPAFVLFPPLVFYGAGAASWLAGSIIGGFKLWLIVVALLTALAFHALAREWIAPGLPAALGAGIYLLLPYHVLDMYQRFAIPETTAFIFFPLILLFLRRVVRTGRTRDMAALAACYAGLVYTHLVSAFLFSLLLGPWMVWEGRGRWRAVLRPTAALGCGLLLAAPALLPAALEKSLVNIAWVKETANGDFRVNFIFRDDVLAGLGFKDPVKPPVLRSAHSQLLLAALAAGLALAWTPKRSRARADIAALAAICGAAYVLQLEVSTPVWRLVPELATVQFPWRFQTIMVLATALLCGHAGESGRGSEAGGSAAGRRPAGGAAVLALGAVLLLNLAFAAQNAHLKPFVYTQAQSEEASVRHWSDPSTTPVAFEPYRQLKRTRIDMAEATFTEGTGEAQVILQTSSRRELEIMSPSGGVVVVRSFWFPGWTATLDGQALPIGPSPRMGLTSFRVPPGTHRVEMRFGATLMRQVAWVLGLAGAMAVIAFCLPWDRRAAPVRQVEVRHSGRGR
jgi:hypothetical protein